MFAIRLASEEVQKGFQRIADSLEAVHPTGVLTHTHNVNSDLIVVLAVTVFLLLVALVVAVGSTTIRAAKSLQPTNTHRESEQSEKGKR